jgi:hypothetical protein
MTTQDGNRSTHASDGGLGGVVHYLRVQWDRVLAWVTIALGLVSIVLGFYGVSGTDHLVEQVPYLASGAVLGIFALGLGATLWLSADLRDEWRKLDDLERAITEANVLALSEQERS